METYTMAPTLTVENLVEGYKSRSLNRLFTPNSLNIKFVDILTHADKQLNSIDRKLEDIQGIIITGPCVSRKKNDSQYVDLIFIMPEKNDGTDRYESNFLPKYHTIGFSQPVLQMPGLRCKYITLNGILNEIDKDNPGIINGLKYGEALALDDERLLISTGIEKDSKSAKLVWKSANGIYNAVIQ